MRPDLITACALTNAVNIGNVQNFSVSPVTINRALAGWRRDAARLAAELLCVVSPAAADEVLDLRSALLDGSVSAQEVLKAFFAARNGLESEHYLLFYRLRRVLEPALGVEVSRKGAVPVREAVDFSWRNVGQVLRRVRRECFEHDLTLSSPSEVLATICWRF